MLNIDDQHDPAILLVLQSLLFPPPKNSEAFPRQIGQVLFDCKKQKKLLI